MIADAEYLKDLDKFCHLELVCVLCGLMGYVVNNPQDFHAPEWDPKCYANAGSFHVHPKSPQAQIAKEIRQAWLRDPMAEVPA